MFGRGELKPHTFPLRYSPLIGEMSALALTEGSVCASKRVIPLIREMSSLRDKRMTLAVDEVFSLFTSVEDGRGVRIDVISLLQLKQTKFVTIQKN